MKLNSKRIFNIQKEQIKYRVGDSNTLLSNQWDLGDKKYTDRRTEIMINSLVLITKEFDIHWKKDILQKSIMYLSVKETSRKYEK